MKDFGYVCIYADTVEEMFSDFKDVVKKCFDDENGLYTVFFSRYEEYKIITEVIYIVKMFDYVIFLESTNILVLTLDDDLNATKLSFYSKSVIFCKLMYENDNVEYIDTMCDSKGNVLNVFTLNETSSIAFSKEWKDTLTADLIDKMVVSDLVMAQISDDYLQKRIDKFKSGLSRVLTAGEAYEGFEENPYADAFYNQEI